MIPAIAYEPLYSILVTILTFTMYSRYAVVNESYSALDDDSSPFSYSAGMIPLLVIFLAIYIGTRPNSVVFVDMMNTVEYYYTFYEGVPFYWDSQTENFLYDNFLSWCGSMRLGTSFFFTVIAFIYFGCSYLGIRRMFPNHTALVYLAFLGAFSTFSYATNGVKAGSAASIFIWAISYYKEWKYCIPLLIVSYGFHHSMQMPIVAFLFSALWRNTKHFFWGWAFCFLCAAAHVTYFQELFAGMTDEQGSGYLNSVGEDWGGGTGFRIDFILYSAVPIVIGYIAIFRLGIQSAFYEVLLKLYLLTNGVWMLCMYAAFTNRIAYLSWSLYPIVLLYPLLNEDWGIGQYRLAARVLLGHLAFTLFIAYIYYNLIR